mmetsp:Transcript_154196/g.287465  ORF Transcript_154196/g.287465 Transcript_154196/m.287465 type:complete len:388 (+) Transcript_154196:48-1211(+)
MEVQTRANMETEESQTKEEDIVIEQEESKFSGAEEHGNGHSCSSSPIPMALPMAKVHRSGVPFPPELLSRFQEDLSKQGHFKNKYEQIKGKHCYGAPRPHMSLNLRTEDEDRKLLVAAALFYNEVKKRGKCCYAHHHHPDWLGHDGTYGIDCSNFTSHIYNLCLGVRFTSAIKPQSQMGLPKVTSWNALRPGDLAFFTSAKSSQVGHVGICIEGQGRPSVIHSTTVRVQGKNGPMLSWSHDRGPINRFSHGFRFEDLRKAAAIYMIRTGRLKSVRFGQTELRKGVLDAGIPQEQLDKAADMSDVKDDKMQLIVDVALSKADKKAAAMALMAVEGQAVEEAKSAPVDANSSGNSFEAKRKGMVVEGQQEQFQYQRVSSIRGGHRYTPM